MQYTDLKSGTAAQLADLKSGMASQKAEMTAQLADLKSGTAAQLADLKAELKADLRTAEDRWYGLALPPKPLPIGLRSRSSSRPAFWPGSLCAAGP